MFLRNNGFWDTDRLQCKSEFGCSDKILSNKNTFATYLTNCTWRFVLVRGESHIDFRTQPVIMMQITWPPHTAIGVISRFLTNVSNALDSNYIFEAPLYLYCWLAYIYNCWLAFFLFCCEFKAKLKKLFNLSSSLRWGAQYPRYTEYSYYFRFSNCSNAGDFLNWT